MASSKRQSRTMKDPAPAPPRVSYLVKRVERGVRAALDNALREMRITTSEYTALSVLRYRTGLSSAQLARRSFVSAQAMNQIVVSLERNGWIQREQDPDHGRILRAILTREGRDMLTRCDKATADIEDMLLSGLSDKQVEQLREALETCATSLIESTLSANPPHPDD